MTAVTLRPVRPQDVGIFRLHQADPVSTYMAAFAPPHVDDPLAFAARWDGFLADATCVIRTIEADGAVAGHVLSFLVDGDRYVGYWLGRESWGRGIATAALTAFLRDDVRDRPLWARVAADNIGSQRVLERCGFRLLAHERAFATARGAETDEMVMQLLAPP